MKIILSRKGFDSEYGGVASPIYSDGSLLSLPIPSTATGSIRYAAMRAPYGTLGSLTEDLTDGRVTPKHRAHLDPDLRASTLSSREPGWRPIFGQAGIAQRHLAGAGVSVGDLFLFFGWFRQIDFFEGRYRFVPFAPDLHVIFGWLQIGDILPAGRAFRASAPNWAKAHPHFYGACQGNAVYIARRTLNLPGINHRLPGAGVFAKLNGDLCLTAPGQSRSVWKLPRWFAPTKSRSIFTYHSDIKRWTLGRKFCQLQTVAKGQEFVLDADKCSEATTWAENLIVNSV
jgi:Nucleotide modification associated domain 3